MAAVARRLAVHFALSPNDMFTCGFLHDLGKLILLEDKEDSCGWDLKDLVDESDVLHLRERNKFGFDHTSAVCSRTDRVKNTGTRAVGDSVVPRPNSRRGRR